MMAFRMADVQHMVKSIAAMGAVATRAGFAADIKNGLERQGQVIASGYPLIAGQARRPGLGTAAGNFDTPGALDRYY